MAGSAGTGLMAGSAGTGLMAGSAGTGLMAGTAGTWARALSPIPARHSGRPKYALMRRRFAPGRRRGRIGP